jgi:inorganic pyrophosphatase
MSLDAIPPVNTGIDDFNTVIEIPANSAAVKYEIDKASGLLVVDRFMPTAMHYPCDYGFVPNTLSTDGDPVDVLVISPLPIQPGCLMRTRAVGMLRMTDEHGEDNKILALPIKKICARYVNKDEMSDLSPVLLDSIIHFFEHYKGLEADKWVKVEGWADKDAAKIELQTSIERFNKAQETKSA